MSAIKPLVLFYLLLFSAVCATQNKTNGLGLRYGHWRYNSPDYILEGDYKIVPISLYDTIHSDIRAFGTESGGYLEVRYKKREVNVYVSGIRSDSLSVQDGVWNAYDTTTQKLAESELWANGISMWRKKFDEQGTMTNFDYENYAKDSSVYLTYLGNTVFRKDFYPPGDHNNTVTEYYPDCNLSISNAEPVFDVNFISKPAATLPVKITAEKAVVLTGIKGTENVTVLDKDNTPLKYPLALKKNEQLTLNIAYTPHAASYSQYDTIAVFATDIIPTYKIICHGSSAHIDAANVITVKDLSLSRSKDKYLFVKGCGSVTDFHIADASEKRSSYNIVGAHTMKVPLANFQPGKYSLTVLMGDCNASGTINLQITE